MYKYDSAGNQQWGRQIGTPQYESAFGVCVDSLGDVCMAGYTSGPLAAVNPSHDYQAFVSKLGPSGQTQWVSQFGNPSMDMVWGVCSDRSNDFYACGSGWGSLSGPSAGGKDAFLRKYDSAGNVLWTQQFGTAVDDDATRVTTDSLGYVYVTGYSWRITGSVGDHFLRKYSDHGDLMWAIQGSTPLL